MATSSIFKLGWTWTAIFAGVITSLVLQILLTMFGFGVGLLAIDGPTANSAPAGISWAAFLWWAASGIFSAFVGGTVAAMHSPDDSEEGRVSHSIAAWAVTTVLIVGAAGLAAGTSASVASNLSGPVYTTGSRLVALSRTPGQPAPTQAQLETARKHFATMMLASFVALLLGAGAAYGAGVAIDEPVRGRRRR